NVAYGPRARKVPKAEVARRVDELLGVVRLEEFAKRRPSQLSGGQQQRVALAMALVGEPDLMLLDEPTVGLDVAARRAFWQVLARRRAAGVGIVLTTHILEEAAAMADRVVVLHRGRVIAEDTPAGLTGRLADRTLTARTELDLDALRGLPGVLTAERDGGRVRLTSAEPERVLRAWLPLDTGLSDLRVEGAGLEQALLALTDADSPTDPAESHTDQEVPA
ncbi:MAG TPA: ABC transporter ATP-binding protein, partial [Pseudonocardia sp.]|nr:ABC transporter ATP-binding protein [Pseudonocardia sp.]